MWYKLIPTIPKLLWADSITIFTESWNDYKNWWVHSYIYTTWYIALVVIQNYNKIKYCIISPKQPHIINELPVLDCYNYITIVWTKTHK